MKFLMKKPFGYSFHFGINSKFMPTFMIMPIKLGTLRPKTIEHKEYFNESEVANVTYFGIRFDISFGTLRYPVSPFYKKEFWLTNARRFGDKNYIEKESNTNGWNSGKHIFTITIPFMPAFFISACLGNKKTQPGFYLGFKTFKVDHISSQLLNYETQEYQFDENGDPIYTWATKEEQGNFYLCLSASTRSDLIED